MDLDTRYAQRLPFGGSKLRRFALSPRWTFLGPQRIAHDNLYGSPEAVGRVNAVLPLSRDLLFAAADRGGVWKSTNAGDSWTPLTDDLPFPNITALAFDGARVFAGTGHGVVLRSANLGESWDVLVVPGALRITSLAAPSAQSLLAGVEQGVVRSIDHGHSWTLALRSDAPHLTMGPTRVFATSPQGLHASSDGGASWTRIALPFQGPRLLRTVASGSTWYLMASSASRFEGLWRSNDEGLSWRSMGATIPGCSPCPPMDLLAAHPFDSDTLFLGRVWLYRSINGGETFEDVNKSPSGIAPHVDHRGLAFSPDGGLVYDANDGGICIAPHDQSRPPDWRHRNGGLAITQFYPGMSQHPTDPSQLLAGTQDNGFVTLRNGVWRTGLAGDFMWTAIDPRNPLTAFAVLYPGGDMVIRTRNGWEDFVFAGDGIDTDRAPWISPLEMDPNDSDTLYFGTVRVFRTSDQGGRWRAISPELGPVSALAVASGDSNAVYAAASGRILAYRGGQQWTTLGTGQLPRRNIARLIAFGSSNVYAAYSGLRSADGLGHIYVSEDAGIHWRDLTANLPDIPVNDLLLDGTTLYAATDAGVYSLQQGQWLPLGSGLPLTTVTSIRLHEPTRKLRAATYGRGVWELSLP